MILALKFPPETVSWGGLHWGAKFPGTMLVDEAPDTVHELLLLGCSNGMKIPDPDEYQAMRVPLPS
jgi:hypothetical protein